MQAEDVTEALQEVFLDLNFSSVTKGVFTCPGLEKFWTKYTSQSTRKISLSVLKVSVTFSTLVNINTMQIRQTWRVISDVPLVTRRHQMLLD